MWRNVNSSDADFYKKLSYNLLCDEILFSKAGNRVIEDWPYSSEANLTASVINHQAWIGQASCAINHNAPEYITKLAWRELTLEQQSIANNVADRVIEIWREAYWEKINA